jgi:hypothetical protein
MFLWQMVSVFLFLLACWRLSAKCSPDPRAGGLDRPIGRASDLAGCRNGVVHHGSVHEPAKSGGVFHGFCSDTGAGKKVPASRFVLDFCGHHSSPDGGVCVSFIAFC